MPALFAFAGVLGGLAVVRWAYKTAQRVNQELEEARLARMYSDVVLGFEHHHFEDILDTFKDSQGYSLDTDLTGDDWVELVGKYKEAVERETGHPFPQDPHAQLWGAIGAVFSSWMNARAVTYRKLHDIPASWGTAVNVQAMVFGNMQMH